MKRTPPDPTGNEDERAQVLRDQLKEAVIGLIEHMGSEAFYVELSANEREPMYLVFGSGALIKQFANTLPPGESFDGGDGDPALIH